MIRSVIVFLTLAALVLSLVGCCPSSIALDARFRPLAKIEADPSIPPDVYATTGDVVRTPSRPSIRASGRRSSSTSSSTPSVSSRTRAVPRPTSTAYARDVSFKIAEERSPGAPGIGLERGLEVDRPSRAVGAHDLKCILNADARASSSSRFARRLCMSQNW